MQQDVLQLNCMAQLQPMLGGPGTHNYDPKVYSLHTGDEGGDEGSGQPGIDTRD